MNVKHFDYRPAVLPSLFAMMGLAFAFYILLCLTVAAVEPVYRAAHFIKYFADFNARQVWAFWWFTGLIAICSVITLCNLYYALSAPREIVLDNVAITAPAGSFSANTITVLYTSIKDAQVVTMRSGKKTIVIRFDEHVLRIEDRMLGRNFNLFVNALASHITLLATKNRG